MRIRTTFVSNSSSTSFLVELPNKCTLNDLISLGIEIDKEADVAIIELDCTTYSSLCDCWKRLKRHKYLSEADDPDAFQILLTVLTEIDAVVETESLDEGWNELRIKKGPK